MSSSVSSTAQNGQSSWDVKSYLNRPFAAGFAIVPAFYGFAAKSAQQLEQPVPKPSVKLALEAFKTAPTVGVIVGTQLGAQSVIEKNLLKKDNTQPSLSSKLLSSGIVGFLSSPFLAIFNGQTMGRTPWQTLKGLTALQVSAITLQEASFVASQACSEPVSEKMKKVFGNNKGVDYGSTFMTGAFGALCGHPANTALTRWQEGLKVEAKHLMLGAKPRAVAVGVFSVVYKWAKEKLS